ncbi:sulfur carrier protein ThiS [Mangrovibacterium lignilyticum]|uniref:sulfur carrier protein ThiS n=1 Tax=Mangrovibacterium lignilyticum TaxID=2668052 RepID=UPI0013D51AEC|nr:sulfur carrier protein ThiS [Mangrovibacterium lignilyticum]
MNVIVNHQSVELPDPASISDLLFTLKIESPKGIALAINDEILRKDRWNEFLFSENDKVLIIKATQGG